MSRWLPENVSTYGSSIDNMFYFIYYLTGAVFLLVAAAMLYYVFKYRDRGDGRRAIYSHGNNTLEVIWTAIPAVVFIIIGVASARTWADVKINPPPADLVIQLEAKQFNWRFVYPGKNGTFEQVDDRTLEGFKRKDRKDDKQTFETLYVPVNKVVHLEMRSYDVLHSFFVPQLRVKQDTVPGRSITLWFEATKTGTYEIACAELCGLSHTTMRGLLQVQTEEEFKKTAMDKKLLSEEQLSSLSM